MVRFSAPPAEGEAKAQAGPIGPSLLEEEEQFVDVFIPEAAFIPDLE